MLIKTNYQRDIARDLKPKCNYVYYNLKIKKKKKKLRELDSEF